MVRVNVAAVVLLTACAGGQTPTPTPNAGAATTTHPTPSAAAAATPNIGADGNSSAPRAPDGAQAPAATRPTPQVAPIDIPEIDRLMADGIAAGKLPGAVIAVGRARGVLFQRAYGQRSLVPARAPMTADTIFDLASLTKPLVTASSVMWLAERGLLRLNAPVATYLPELQDARARDITVAQLLLHSSGLPRVNPLRDYAGHALGHHDDARAALLRTRPTVRPGTRYLYSDVGYLWLGMLVERIARQPLDVFAHAHLFAPLGLQDTGFRPAQSELARIAPTEHTDQRPGPPGIIHGVVHDPRAYRLGGVAGNAGLFSTAADMGRIARTWLSGGALDGARILGDAAVQTMGRPHEIGNTVRTLGWDVRSDYDGHRGSLLSPAAFGHGGYTGVSLWIDPLQDLFVLFLSNRVHPDGDGDVIRLAGAIADAAVRATSQAIAHAPCSPDGARDANGGQGAAPEVLPGIDVLARAGFEPLRGKRVGLVTHLAAVNRAGVPTLEVLSAAQGMELAALFTPEHGLESQLEGTVASGHDSARGIPVHSLFGKTRRPTLAMLEGLDVLVVDLVDVGVRFYTYASTLAQVMAAAADAGIPVLVLDRPNPIGGLAVEGPVRDDDVDTFVNYHRLPVRHGMTLGELASLLASEKELGVLLGVVPVQGWRRGQHHSETGLPFRAPSPNLRSPDALELYAAVGLLESTNLSVGRGTDTPFEVLGAPWLDAGALLRNLRAAQLPGVQLEETRFTPSARPHRDIPCAGLRLRVTDPHTFAPVETALAIARALQQLHPQQWQGKDLQRLLAHKRTLQALLRLAPLGRIQTRYSDGLEAFKARRSRFLRYPACD